MDNADETAGGQSRSHGQGKVGRMLKRISADLDLDKVREVRNTWQFYRDRRPEMYGEIADTGTA